jgi:acylphosphatase
MKKRLSVVVTGLVQGVNFRYFTKAWAEKLGLTGYVKNKSDGSVEVEAEGDEEKLKELLEKLRVGPPMARVEKIKENWEKYSGSFKEFTIRF